MILDTSALVAVLFGEPEADDLPGSSMTPTGVSSVPAAFWSSL